jgi:hypothetical protein
MLLGVGFDFFLDFRRNLFSCWLWVVGQYHFFDWIFAHVFLSAGVYPGMFRPLAGSGVGGSGHSFFTTAGICRTLLFV